MSFVSVTAEVRIAPISLFIFHPLSGGLSDEGDGCCLKHHLQLVVGFLRRSFEGVVEPVPEVTVGKQVQTKQRHQAAEGQIALGAELEILEHQHSD